MNLLYLLVALGLMVSAADAQKKQRTTRNAASADSSTNSTANSTTNSTTNFTVDPVPTLTSSGWYVGDCFETNDTYSGYFSSSGLCEGECEEEVVNDTTTTAAASDSESTGSSGSRRRRPSGGNQRQLQAAEMRKHIQAKKQSRNKTSTTTTATSSAKNSTTNTTTTKVEEDDDEEIDYSSMYPYQAKVQLKGHQSRSTAYETYCTHDHLYNFLYADVTPSSEDNTEDDLNVVGYTMVGITPELCHYNPSLTIDFPIYEGEEQQTLANEFGLVCGYHVEYIWIGSGDVSFNIYLNHAIIASGSLLAALLALFSF